MGLIRCVHRAAGLLRKTLLQHGVNGVLVAQQPLIALTLGLDEVKCMSKQLGWGGIGAMLKLPLDTRFEGRIESQADWRSNRVAASPGHPATEQCAYASARLVDVRRWLRTKWRSSAIYYGEAFMDGH